MKRKILPLLTPILFFGFLSVLLVWALIKPPGVSSGAEGRALAQKPVKDLTDLPALIERCNDYVADQFPMRETLLKLDSAAQIYTGKRLIRGITVDAEGYLLPQLYRADPAQRDARGQAGALRLLVERLLAAVDAQNDRPRHASMASSIRRSSSSGYGMPLASKSFGYIEIDVKPGIVLISLNTTSRSLRVTKKSTRESPRQPSAR